MHKDMQKKLEQKIINIENDDNFIKVKNKNRHRKSYQNNNNNNRRDQNHRPRPIETDNRFEFLNHLNDDENSDETNATETKEPMVIGLVSDSLVGGVRDSALTRSRLLKTKNKKLFCVKKSGAPVAKLKSYCHAALVESPTHMIIHVGANDVKAEKTPEDIASEIIKLRDEMAAKSVVPIISGIVARGDDTAMNEKGMRVNEIVKKQCDDDGTAFMDNSNIDVGQHMGKGEKPTPPVNLLADFAGGGMIAAIGVVTALFERQRSGLGQVVEASMTEGASYISSFLQCSRDMGIWMGERGSNLLDTGAPFYDTYATKDGRYMAVGAIEPQFYQRFLTGLGREDLAGKEYKISEWPEVKEEIAKTFLTKTFEEWTEIFAPIDACVTPVIDLYEAPHHPHNISSESFMKDGDNFNPSPAPRLSRTPAVNKCRPLPHTVGEHTRDVLLEYGFQQTEINDLIEENHVEEPKLPSSKL